MAAMNRTAALEALFAEIQSWTKRDTPFEDEYNPGKVVVMFNNEYPLILDRAVVETLWPERTITPVEAPRT
jgi:hypothetical protein